MSISAQEAIESPIEITGQVLNDKTLEPIPYAHIVISNTSIGTVSNGFGAFRLVLPNKYANGTLEISSIGFESTFINLSSTKNLLKLSIELKESTKFLESVVIVPVDEARLLIEQAIERIGDNYPTESYSSEEFFRSVAKLNNKIYFPALKRNIEGALYINLRCKSFVKGQYFYRPPDFEVNLLENLKITKRINLNYEANYKEGNKGWELFVVNYNTSFVYNGDTLSVRDTYVTTHTLEKYQEIKYDPTFWNIYNIILPDKETEMLFKKHNPSKEHDRFEKQEKELSKREKLSEQIGKIKFALGVFMQPTELSNTNINYVNGSSIISENIPATSFYYTGLSTAMEYYFSPSYFIGLDSKGSFAGNGYSSWSLKTGYNQNFNSFGRPATANFSGNIGHYRYGYVVGKYNVEDDLKIYGKSFDSGEV